MSDRALVTAMGERGARLIEVEGWTVAASFGDSAREYRALRESAAVVEVAWLGRLQVSGSDRVDFLQGMLSNDVKTLAVGTGCPALLLSEQGKVVADLIVLAFAETVALDGARAGLAAAQAALERFIVADDVTLTPAGSAEHAFALLGPTASDVLARLGAPRPAAPYHHAAADLDGIALDVVRVPSPGVGGFLCWVSSEAAGTWWARCVEAGGAVAAGYEAFEALRIESGLPSYGRDVGPDTLALEAPYEAAISFRKGCYLGQEVMERVTARGHVNRKLVGLQLSGDSAPSTGERVRAGDREVGWVTSAAWSWRLGCPVALAYVRREHLAPGTVLTIGAAPGTPATVRAPPF